MLANAWDTGRPCLAHPSFRRATPFLFLPTLYRLSLGEPLASPRGYNGTLPPVPPGEFIQIPSSVPSWPATLLRGILIWHQASLVASATPPPRRTVVIETPHAFRRLTSTLMRHAYDVCGRWFMLEGSLSTGHTSTSCGPMTGRCNCTCCHVQLDIVGRGAWGGGRFHSAACLPPQRGLLHLKRR